MKMQREKRYVHPGRRFMAVMLIAAQLILMCPESVFASGASAEEPAYKTGSGNRFITARFCYPSFLKEGDKLKGPDGTDLADTCYYTDDYFSDPAIDYTGSTGETSWKSLKNHSLATASLCLAMSAFGSNVDNYSVVKMKADYSQKYRNGEDLLTKLGFEDIYHNDWFTKKPESDSIGVIIAQKDIVVNNGQSYVLRAVAIRGAGYESEWASNVSIGLSNVGHQGFNDAADKVVKEVKKYHEEHPVNNKSVKYWIVGYSRAGATANLTSGKITDRAGDFGSRKEDVYGYTFEAPQGAAIVNGQKSIQQLKYRNIHNIVNKMDLVPRVSPWQFGHQRLGIDYILPCRSNVYAWEYSNYKSAMKAMLSVDSGMEKLVDSYPDDRPIDIYTFNIAPWSDRLEKRDGKNRMADLGGSVYMDDLIDKLLSKVVASNAWGVFLETIFTDNTIQENKEYYVKDYQNDFRRIVAWVMSGELGQHGKFRTVIAGLFGLSSGLSEMMSNPVTMGGLATEISAVAAQPKWLQAALYPARAALYARIRSMLKPFLTVYDGTEISSAVNHIVPVLMELFLNDRSTYEQNYLGTLLHYSGDLFTTHVPEVTLAWMKSLDKNYSGSNPGGKGMTELTLDPGQLETVVFVRKGQDIPFAVYTNNELTGRENSVRVEKNVSGDRLRMYYPYKDVTVLIKPNNNYNSFIFSAKADYKTEIDEAYRDPMAGKEDIFELTQDADGNFSFKRRAHITIKIDESIKNPDQESFKAFLEQATYTEEGERKGTLANNDLVLTDSAKLSFPLFKNASGDGKNLVVTGYTFSYDDAPDTKISGTCAIKGIISISQTKESFKTDRSRTYYLSFTETKEQTITVKNGARLYDADTGNEVEQAGSAGNASTDTGTTGTNTKVYKVASGTRVCLLPYKSWMNTESAFRWTCTAGDNTTGDDGIGGAAFFNTTDLSPSDYLLTFRVPQFSGYQATFGTESVEPKTDPQGSTVQIPAIRIRNAVIEGTEKISETSLNQAGIYKDTVTSDYLIKGGNDDSNTITIDQNAPLSLVVKNTAASDAESSYKGYFYTGWKQGFYNDENYSDKKKVEGTDSETYLEAIETVAENPGAIGVSGQTDRIVLAAADKKGRTTGGSYICIEPRLQETGARIVVLDGILNYEGERYGETKDCVDNIAVIGAGKSGTIDYASAVLTPDELLAEWLPSTEGMSEEDKKEALREYGLDPAGYEFKRWILQDEMGEDVTGQWIFEGVEGVNPTEGITLRNPLSLADLKDPENMPLYFLSAEYSEKEEKVSLASWSDSSSNVSYGNYGLIEVTEEDGRTAYYGAEEEVPVHFGDCVTLGAGVHPFKAVRAPNVEGSRYDLTKGWSFETIKDNDKDLYFDSWMLRDGSGNDITQKLAGVVSSDASVQTFRMPSESELKISQKSVTADQQEQQSTSVKGRRVVSLSIESDLRLEDGVYFRADLSQPLTKDTVLQGSRIDLCAPETNGNKSFYCWQAYTKDENGKETLVYLDDIHTQERETFFTMPYEDIFLTPVYLSDADSVTIKVVNGKTVGEGSCRPGDVIYLQANSEGQKESFAGWESSEASVRFTSPLSASTGAVIPRNASGKTIVMTAKFVETQYIATEIKPLPVVELAAGSDTGAVKNALTKVKTVNISAQPMNGGSSEEPSMVTVTVPVDWNMDAFDNYTALSDLTGTDQNEFMVIGTLRLTEGRLEGDPNTPCVVRLGDGMTGTVMQRFKIGSDFVSTPLPNYEGGTFDAPLKISIPAIPSGAYGYYTIDGSLPAVDWSKEQSLPLPLQTTKMLSNDTETKITLEGKAGQKVVYTLMTEACRKTDASADTVDYSVTGVFVYTIDRRSETLVNPDPTITISDASGKVLGKRTGYKPGDSVVLNADSLIAASEQASELAFGRWSAGPGGVQNDQALINDQDKNKVISFTMPDRDVNLQIDTLQKIKTAYIDFGNPTEGILPQTATFRAEEGAQGISVNLIWRKSGDSNNTNIVAFGLYPGKEVFTSENQDKYAMQFVDYDRRDASIRDSVSFYVRDGANSSYRPLDSSEIIYGASYDDGHISLELAISDFQRVTGGEYPVVITAQDTERNQAIGFNSYDEAGNKTTSESITLYFEAGTASVTAPEIEGYMFRSWEAGDSILASEDKSERTVSITVPVTEAGVTLKANYIPLISDIVLEVQEPRTNTEIENLADRVTLSLGGESYELNPRFMPLFFQPGDLFAEPSVYYELTAELAWDIDESSQTYIELRRIYEDAGGSITGYGDWERYYGDAIVLGDPSALIRYETMGNNDTAAVREDKGFVVCEENGGLSSIGYVFDMTAGKEKAAPPDAETILASHIDYEEELFTDPESLYELYDPTGETIPDDPGKLAQAQAGWVGTEAENYPLYDLTGKDIYVRIAETEELAASDWVRVTLPNRSGSISGENFEIDYENETVKKKSSAAGISRWQFALEESGFDLDTDYPLFFTEDEVSGDEVLYLEDAGYEEDSVYEKTGGKLYVRIPADPQNHIFAGELSKDSAQGQNASFIPIPTRPVAPIVHSLADGPASQVGSVTGMLSDVTEVTGLEVQYREALNREIGANHETPEWIAWNGLPDYEKWGEWKDYASVVETTADGTFTLTGLTAKNISFRVRYPAANNSFASCWSAAQSVTIENPAEKTDAEVSVSGTGISDGKLTLTYGEERTLTAASADNSEKGGKWSFVSDTPSVVTVKDKAGGSFLISARAAGKAVITVSYVSYDSEALKGSATLNITVDKKKVTITGIRIPASKAFDGTVAVKADCSSARIEGVLASDEGKVAIKEGYAAYSDARVGTNKIVSFHDFALTGERAANYELSAQPEEQRASITREASPIRLERTYLSGIVSTDSIDLTAYLPDEYGDAAYEISWVKRAEGLFEKEPEINDRHLLQYTIRNNSERAEAEFTVTAVLQNYTDIVFIINVAREGLSVYLKDGGSYSADGSWLLYTGQSTTVVPVFAGKPVNKKVVYHSSNPNVASIKQNGKLTGISRGQSVITVLSEDSAQNGSSGPMTAKFTVTVAESIRSITLDRTSYRMGTGESVTLSARIMPYGSLPRLDWSVSNENASITEISGDTHTVTIKANRAGKVRVRATAGDGSNKKASCSISIGEPVQSFTVEAKGGKNFTAIGKTLQMAVAFKGTRPKNTEMLWSIETEDGEDASDIAFISKTGILTGIREGRVVVRAQSIANPEKYATKTMEIYVPIKSVKLNTKSGILSEKSGNALELETVIASGQEGLTATGKELQQVPDVVFSADPNSKYASYLSIEKTGDTTARVSLKSSAGKAPVGKTIRVMAAVTAYNGYTKTVTCSVAIRAENPFKSVRLSKTSLSLPQDTSYSLETILTPQNPDNGATCTWSVQDKTGQVTVDNGLVTGVKPGTAKVFVTVTSGNLKKTASCDVTVLPRITEITLTNRELTEKDQEYALRLAAGKTMTLKVKLACETGKPSNSGLYWQSEDDTVASVSEKGKLKALRNGTTVIIVKSPDGKIERRVFLTVYTPVKKIRADKSKLTIGTAEMSRIGRIYIEKTDPIDVSDPSIRWSVAKDDTVRLLAVDISGGCEIGDFDDPEKDYTKAVTGEGQFLAVRAENPGVVKLNGITVDGSNRKVSCTVTVRGSVAGLSLTEKAGRVTASSAVSGYDAAYAGSVRAGARFTVTPVVSIMDMKTNTAITPDGNRTLYKKYKLYTDLRCSYYSTNTDVATVSNEGRITVKKGTAGSSANIIVTSADGKYRAILKVNSL